MTPRTLWKAFVNVITAPFRFVRWIFRGIAKFFRDINNFFNQDVEDAPLPDAVAKTLESPGDILPHLDALRRHLTRAVLALVIATALAFFFNRQILSLLALPLEGGMDSLIAIEVTEPIGTVMRVSLMTGFAISFPYIAFEIWAFIAPGLSPRSRKTSMLAIPIATLFFLGGMTFAYFIMLPAALPFLLNFMGISTIPRPSSYIKFVTGIMFWIGVAFEFPLVIFLLAMLGWVKSDMLKKQWRLAVVIIAVVAALITPTIDPVNMALVMGPLIILYFFSILLARIAESRRAIREQAEAT
jgi:sec-independent protein translocase protein TatC